MAGVAAMLASGCGDDAFEATSGPGGGGASSTSTSASPSSTSTGDGGAGASTSSQGGDGASGQGGEGGGDGGGGSGPGCTLAEGQPLGGSCGIFVDADAATDGDGSQASPRSSLAAAVADASDGDTIYACASASGHDEAVTLTRSVTLVGGLDCASWVYTAAGRTSLTAEPDAIPLRITGASTEAHVEGFAITAASATAPGGSSIAVLVAEGTASFARSEVVAGDGAAGVSAEPEARAADAAAGSSPMLMGCDGLDGVIGGGGGGQNTCQGSVRDGGRGGSGTPDPDGDTGNPGRPLPPDGGGVGGLGEGLAASCATGGTGGDGAHGAAGTPGVQLKDAVAEAGAQAFHPGQGVSDGGGEWGFARDRGELHGEPNLQPVEDRGRMCLAKRDADLWR
jgi:hypothetical protein